MQRLSEVDYLSILTAASWKTRIMKVNCCRANLRLKNRSTVDDECCLLVGGFHAVFGSLLPLGFSLDDSVNSTSEKITADPIVSSERLCGMNDPAVI